VKLEFANKIARYRVPLGILSGIVLIVLPTTLNPYLLRIATLAGIYMILASSLNIVIGFTGMFSLGHGAFYGIGAYVSALLAINFGLPFWVTILMAGIVAGFFGALIGLATLRLRAIFLAFTTLGFGEITRIVILNWIAVTRGPMGVPGIPIPKLFGYSFGPLGYYYLILLMVLLTVLVIRRIYMSRVGRAFIAIREDELAAMSMGVNVFAFKSLAFTLACAIAGIVGAYYAHFARFISADQFGGNESFMILTMVALGGTGSILGPLLGALILVVIPEMFRFLSQYRMVLYGLILLMIIVTRPGGLMGVRGIFERPEALFKRTKKRMLEE
jgi:branched-chain amino acid transport system permease protein